GIGGFALAYVVIFVFVLPSRIVPAAPQPYVPDSTGIMRPIDTTLNPPPPPIEPPIVGARLIEPPPEDAAPILTPDLVGMSLPDARGVLNGFRLRSAVARDTSSFQPPNTVLSQSPLPDSLIHIGETVRLIVSYFPRDSTADTMPVQRGNALPPIRLVPDATVPVRHRPDSAARVPETIPRPRDTTPRPDTLHPW
ncbi:MAG: PASTA domain-containing protein, partial [Gemmatimonadaceae bacterium]